MIVYVETNFILELAFAQEQYENCEKLIELCESGDIKLVLPAFCIAESYEKLIRQAKKRTQIERDIKKYLEEELGQLSRSELYKSKIDALRSITGLLAQSVQEEEERLTTTLEQILRIADFIPFDAQIVRNAAQHRAKYRFEPQDSFVYASILHHLDSVIDLECCFINRNSRDFDDPDIVESLAQKNCKMLFNFNSGYNYIQYRIGTPPTQ